MTSHRALFCVLLLSVAAAVAGCADLLSGEADRSPSAADAASRSQDAAPDRNGAKQKGDEAPAPPPAPTFVLYDGQAKELKLPGMVADVVLAGEGRFVLLYLKSIRKIAVYDVNQAEVTRYLPVAGDSVIAAGAEKLIIVNTAQNLIERWSLSTWKRETVQPLPFSGVFKTMALGYASRGPLLVHWAEGSSALARAKFTFLDLETLKPAPGLGDVSGRNSCYRDYVHIRASADGRVYGLWCTSHSPQGLEVFTLDAGSVEKRYEHSSAGHLCPNPDGSAILTGDGLYTAELHRRTNNEARTPVMPHLPTTHPAFFLIVPAEPGRQHNMGLTKFAQGHADLGDVRSGRRIGDVAIGVLGEGEGTSWARHDFTIDKRVHYIVQAGQVVTVPFTNDRLLVTPLRLTDVFEKSEADYLVVTSVPPRTCRRGDRFAYQVVVESRRDDVSFELSAAPPGMTLTPEGVLRWNVPTDYAEDVAVVIITLTSGEETDFHTFRLDVE